MDSVCHLDEGNLYKKYFFSGCITNLQQTHLEWKSVKKRDMVCIPVSCDTFYIIVRCEYILVWMESSKYRRSCFQETFFGNEYSGGGS